MEPIQIASNELHVWFIRDEEINDVAELQYYHSLLTEEEARQQQRFYFERNRHQYLITRAMQRTILSLYQPDILPQDWLFHKSSAGKPYIDATQSCLLFNISHTKGLIVIGISKDQIGIDVECLRRDINDLALLSNSFTQKEIQTLNNYPEEKQKEYFFRLWTLKEAYSKAIGTGLSSLNNLIYQEELTIELPNWQFWELYPAEDYQVSLAVNFTKNRYQQICMREMVTLNNFEQVNYSLKEIKNVSIT